MLWGTVDENRKCAVKKKTNQHRETMLFPDYNLWGKSYITPINGVLSDEHLAGKEGLT